MRRRHLLRAGAAAVAAGLAGCTAGSTGTDATTGSPSDSPSPTSTPRDDLRGIYVQPYVEGMYRAGTKRAGDYAVTLLYTVPHRFWTVTGSELSAHEKESDDSVHLMATVWDPETGTVLPGTGLSVEIAHGDELVSQETIYPMLSQRMGFHYGANFGLDGDGTYRATVSVGDLALRTTGAFAGRFDRSVDVGIEFPFSESTRERISTQSVDAAGKPGAVAPMEMEGLPIGRAPAPEALPGEVHAKTPDGAPARTQGCDFVATLLSDGGTAADGPYLAVSPRTRYNGLTVPMMGLSARLERGDETLFEGSLTRTLDPELGYHHGAAVDGVAGADRLTVAVETPPQVARHEGYEAAFLRMGEVTIDL